MRGSGSIDSDIHKWPEPAAVARLMDSHSLEACAARWHSIGERTLINMAQRARAAVGVTGQARTRSYSDEDAAVCVEAAFILGSASQGQRAGGLVTGSQGLFNRRGLTMPSISDEERGVVSVLGRRAKAGDAAAIAELERRHDFDRAIGAVLRAALALVPAQPTTGRYRLPPQDARLAEALRDHDPAAVALAFPELTILPSEPEQDVNHATPTEAAPAVEAASPAPRGRLPDVGTLRSLHAEGLSCADVAGRYGVTAMAVHARWSRLGLDTRGRCGRIPPRASTAAPPPSEVVAEPEQAHRPWQPGTDYAEVIVVPGRPGERLSVKDLAVAFDLMRLRSLTPEQAVALVRADVAAARDATTETTHNGMPESAIHGWFDALVSDRPLPSLDQGGRFHG